MTEIEAIRALMARYFRLMDTKDWAGWRTLFTDDRVAKVDHAVSTRGADGTTAPGHTNADTFVAFVRERTDHCTTVHHAHIPEIELLSPDEARGVWAMEDIVEQPGGEFFHGHGNYHETYRKIDGGWRIATLHLTRLRIEMRRRGCTPEAV